MADSGGRILAGDLHPGPDPTAPPVPGAAVIALGPDEEPVSQGLVPVEPTFVRRISPKFRGRSVRAMSGHTISHDKGGAGRPMYELLWQGVTLAQATTLRDFLDGTCQSGALSFETPLDGAGSTPFVVRAIEKLVTSKEHDDVHTLRLGVEAVFVEAAP